MLGRAADVGERVLHPALEVNLARSRFGLEAAHTGGDELRQLGLAELERQHARVDARELEQVVD